MDFSTLMRPVFFTGLVLALLSFGTAPPSFGGSSGQDTATITLTPQNVAATGITQDHGYTYHGKVELTNTGSETMLATNLSHTPETVLLTNGSSGTIMYNATAKACGTLEVNETCVWSSTTTVPAKAAPQTATDSIKAQWQHPNGTVDSFTTSTDIEVLANPRPRIIASQVNGTAPHGQLTKLGEVNVTSYGNDHIDDVQIGAVGGDLFTDCPACTLTIEPDVIGVMDPGATQMVAITLDVPTYTPPGFYWSKLRMGTSNAGYDELLVNATVPLDATWTRTPADFGTVYVQPGDSGLVGNISVRNHGNMKLPLEISRRGEAVPFINAYPFGAADAPAFELAPGGTRNVTVVFDVPEDTETGVYPLDIMLENEAIGMPPLRTTPLRLNVSTMERIIRLNASSRPQIAVRTGETGSGAFQVTAAGTVDATDVHVQCVSGTVCDTFPVAVEPVLFNVSRTGEQQINYTVTVPEQTRSGIYTGTLAFVMDGEEIGRTTMEVLVPVNLSWQQTGSLTSTRLAATNGTLGSLTVTNTGNADVVVDVTAQGDISDYLILEHDRLFVPFEGSNSTAVNVSVPRTDRYTTFAGELLMTNDSVVATPSTAVSLHAIPFYSEIVSPSTSTRYTGVTPADVITAVVNVTAGTDSGLQPVSHNVSFTVALQNEMTVLPVQVVDQSFNAATRLWDVIFLVSTATVDKWVYDLNVTANHTSSDDRSRYHVRTDVEQNAIVFDDRIPPRINLDLPIAIPDGSTVTAGIHVNDTELNVSSVTGTLQTPHTARNVTPTLISKEQYRHVFQYNITGTEEFGHYTVSMTACDHSGDCTTHTHVFQTFGLEQISGTARNLENLPEQLAINSTFEFRDADTGQIITAFKSNATTGVYNETVRERSYDFIYRFFDSMLRHEGMVINRSYHDPVRVGSINTSRVSSSVANVVYVRSDFYANRTRLFLNIPDDTDINSDLAGIYRCPDWSVGRNCNTAWELIGHVDRNRVHGPNVQSQIWTSDIEPRQDQAFAVAQFFAGDGVCEEEFGETYENSPNDCPEPIAAPTPPDDSDGAGDGVNTSNLSVTLETLGKTYLEGGTESILYRLQDSSGDGLAGAVVEFFIHGNNLPFPQYLPDNPFITGSDGYTQTLPSFTLNDDFTTGLYTLVAETVWNDSSTGQTATITSNHTFAVEQDGLLDVNWDTGTVWHPEANMTIHAVTSESSILKNADDITLTVYDPNRTVFFAKNVSQFVNPQTGVYKTWSMLPEANDVQLGKYWARLDVEKDEETTTRFQQFRIAEEEVAKGPGPFDINVSPRQESVEQNDDLDFNLSLINVGPESGDVRLTYWTERNDSRYGRASEAIFMPSQETVRLPRNLPIYHNQPIGQYELHAQVEPLDSSIEPATAAQSFQVVKSKENVTQPEPPANIENRTLVHDKLATITDQIDNLTAVLTAFTESIKTEIAALQNATSSNARQIEELQAAVEALQDENQALREENRKLRQQQDELANDLDTLRENLTNHDHDERYPRLGHNKNRGNGRFAPLSRRGR